MKGCPGVPVSQLHSLLVKAGVFEDFSAYAISVTGERSFSDQDYQEGEDPQSDIPDGLDDGILSDLFDSYRGYCFTPWGALGGTRDSTTFR